MSDNLTLELDDTASASIEQESAITYASKAYLEYAMSVNKGRALPFAQDGLKPVHRRILHAMNKLNLTSTSAPVKSARVVGEVIGKYHPHGDVSVYEAMVLTSQDFSMRYPLVDGQGNFGSRDGDGPAAMRYTEVRFAKHASLYLDEIDKGTVDFTPNYDGSQTEPKLTPARLPMLLANGSSGIGVGMACQFPSHNLTEVSNAAIKLIKNKNTTLDELLENIQGPDLPCGGQIISSKATIRKCYETGRGSLTVRAIYHFEELSRGQWQLVIDEIPPEGSVANVMEDIEAIMNPKPKKDKKGLDQDQEMLKKLSTSLIESVRDASDKETKLRLVITPVSSKVDREALLALLFKHTKLESNISFNMVTVDGKGTPRSLNLIEILQEWITHRFTCVTRRTEKRLEVVRDRIHILDGRRIVFLNVDEVIRIIREANTGEEAKTQLIAKFNLSDAQADDILDMRLRQLAGLELIKIEQELAKLKEEEEYLQELLDNPGKMSRAIVKQMEEDIKNFGDDRRTKVEEAASAKGVASSAPAIVDEPITIILSEKGWIRSRQGHDIDLGALTFKEGDKYAQSLTCRSVDSLIAISEKGRAFSITAGLIQGGRGDGVPINTMFEFAGDKLAYIIAGKDTDRYLMAASNSYGFITNIGSMTAKNKAGKAYMTVKDNGRILPPVKLPDANEGYYLAVFGSNGKLLTMSLDQMKTLNAGGQGVTIMGLNDDEEISALAIVNGEQDLQVTGTVIGAKKTANCKVSPVKDEKYLGVRARKGSFLPVKLVAQAIQVLGS